MKRLLFILLIPALLFGQMNLQNNTVKISSIGVIDSPQKLSNRKVVGANADFTTLKAAVDWFNASATSNTEILLDAGNHSIASTITINSPYGLSIRGLGGSVTNLNAATGLTDSPMFLIKSSVDIKSLTANGSTLASYGTKPKENFVIFADSSSNYTELTDIIIDNFKVGVLDSIGGDLFLFNFILSNCKTGVRINYSTAAIETSTDIETGNFEDCDIGIDLMKATSDEFMLVHLIFKNPTDGISIKYTITDYVYRDPSNIFACTYNEVGTFLSGFDWTNAVNANIEVISNVGSENKTPHVKINVTDNVSATAVTTAGVYYKAAFTNGDSYTCKMTLANGKITYQSTHHRDGFMWLSGNLSVDQTSRNAIICIRKNVFVSGVTGNGSTVTVTTTAAHNLKTGYKVQMLGWTGGTGTWNGVYTITSTGTTTFTYTANGNGTPTGGTAGNIISPMTVRTATSGQPYPFSLAIYLEDMTKDDYYEPYVTSSTNGDNVTVQDICWLFDAR